MADNTDEEDFDVFDDSIDLDKESESGEEEAKSKEDAEPEEKEPETPSGKDDKKESVPIAALKAERSVRQRFQSENEALRKKYEPDEDEPDPVEDPEAYKEYVLRTTKADFRKDIVNNSRDRVLDANPDDAQEKFDAFRLVSASNKEIVEEFDNHPDPAQFAYDKGKAYLDGLYDKALEKAKADLKGKTEEDPKERTEADKRKDSAADTPDLTGSTAAGSNSEPLETMDEDIFADSPYR